MEVSRIPRIKALDHVTVEVTDLEQAMNFYTGVMGLFSLTMPHELTDKDVRWLDLGGGRALHLVENPEARPGQTAHIALEVSDLEQWKDHLKSKNIKIYPPKMGLYRAERLFLFDPSGNRIELVRWL